MANTKVTSGVIKDDAVGADQLAPNAVVTASMVDNAVTTAKIANDAILTAKISDNAVNNAKLSSNSVDSDQYVDGSIDTAHIADSQITSAKLDTNIAVGGTLTVGSHLNMGDGDILKMGADADLQIYHDGSHSYVSDQGTGSLLLRGSAGVYLQNAGGTENMIAATASGAVTLYYSNAAKLATASGGVTVTGAVTATSLNISGDIDVDGTTNLDIVDIDGAVDMASSLILSTNSTAISMKDASGAATRMFILNSANSTYLGPVDSYAGGEILYGASSNVTGHRMYVGAADRFNVTGSSVVVNEASADVDFRVESNGNANMLFVDGGNDNVGIGTATCTNSSGFHTLSISGSTGGQIAFQTNGTGKQYIYSNDTDLNIWNSIDGSLRFHTNNVERLEMSSTATIFNETGADIDFRVESNNVDVMLVVDGGNDKVGIGIVPAATLHVRENAGLNTTVELLRLDCGSTTHVGGKGGKISFRDISVYTPTAEIIARREGVSGGSHLEFSLRDVVRLGLFSDGGFTTTPAAGGHAVFNQGSVDADFRVESNGDTHMFFVDGGNNAVGIGDGTPSTELLLISRAGNQSESAPHMRIQGAGYSGYHWLNGTAYYIGQNSNGRQLRMYSGSNEGVGVYLTNGGNSWSSYSDERLKENIADIGSVTEKIKDIRCVTYNRKDVDDENKHETIGFIAQDFVGKFDQVLDESKVSDTDEETRYSIRYTETIPILMKAIQEQQTLIESLTARIETLEG